MTVNICVFEDEKFGNLLPLVYSRATFELRCGIGSLLDKIVRAYPKAEIDLFCRDYLTEVIKERLPYSVNTNSLKEDGYLFINGRLLISEPIPVEGEEEIGIQDRAIIYLRLRKDKVPLLKNTNFLNGDIVSKLKNRVKIKNSQETLINYHWDIIHHNARQITKDFNMLVKKPGIHGKLYEGVYVLNKENVFIGAGSTIKSGTILDAEKGPIYIDKNVEIFPNVTIEGPVFIGENSKIKIGAKIYEGTSIGEMCKVGGEVEESIIHSYSNKQHDGFLGHAYLGMWVNLGADTNNSDLKNNYGSVKVSINGKEWINSNSTFVGAAIADHSKSAIGTMFNTGTVVGFASNVFYRTFPPKFVPSFFWGSEKEAVTYVLEKAVDTAMKVMKRRKIEMSSAQTKLFETIFKLTEEERKNAGILK